MVSFTYQHFSSDYKNNSEINNQTNNYLLNLFYPKELKNGNVFLIRINTELLNSSINSSNFNSSNLSSVALPIGFQWLSKNKKWKTVVIAIPKIASNFEENIKAKDWQYGGLFLENYSPNQNLKLKAGLYYNKEAFGNFFVPLLGFDWKATERLNFYGTLPTNYKIEYALKKNKSFTGIDFKWVTRSFNLSNYKDNYVRFDELLLKVFGECFIYKNVLLSSEIGYSFGKNPLQYDANTDDLTTLNSIYSPLNKYPVFNIGLSYRIRNNAHK